ncbi:MAG TPA: hypothetical protein VJ576_13570 [Rhodocyclaceae bacterium]|nr:hypothetical protein [Rhodocyclaceae bacterium]
MIVFDSHRRMPVLVDGRALRFQQDIQRFLADSRYYFELPGAARQLEPDPEALPRRRVG